MDKDTFLEKIKEIGTLEDEVERRTALTELSESVSSIFDNNSNLMEENNKYKEDNEKLRSANMQLFLRIGESKAPEEVTKDLTGVKEDNTPEPRKFESLFDDKGGLK